VSERPSDQLLAWAAVGSRISGFHHDSASKLQSMMMAIDEATELAESHPDIARPLETAMAGLKELHALLTENRALAKAPVRKAMPVRDLLQRAAARSAVNLSGELPAGNVFVAPSSMVQALSLLCETIAGTAQGARAISVQATVGDKATITLAGTPPASSTLDAITVATWLIEREEGSVDSAPRGYVIQLPTTAGTP